MRIRARLIRAAALLMFLSLPLLAAAQTNSTLESLISQATADAPRLEHDTIVEWTALHPNDQVDTPVERDRNYDPHDARQHQDRELEGRWCLRSTTTISLADGTHIRRIALFYQPLVEEIVTMPPLPTETGNALRQHGCRLNKILYEVQVDSDPQQLAESIAKHIPGARPDNPFNFPDNSLEQYWAGLHVFAGKSTIVRLYYRNARNSNAPGKQPTVLLTWEGFDDRSSYGSPSAKTIEPLAGQPWLAMRAAALAHLPQASTLAMLSFLAPQVGGVYQQPLFLCDQKLVPVLRQWFALAAKSSPQQHAAALLFADQVLNRVSDCAEFTEDPGSPGDAVRLKYHDALINHIDAMGVDVGNNARLGGSYSGNLLDKVVKLAPSGIVNELAQIAILNKRCPGRQSPDPTCDDTIATGEKFLTRFPPDEWTPSVHLILAEAYSLNAVVQNGEDTYQGDTPTLDPNQNDSLQHAADNYRAWYATSTSEQARQLVWQEIWAIDAGMGPFLLVPEELRNR